MSLTALTFVAMLLWAVILLLPWRPWDTRERLVAQVGAADGAADLSDVVALIPARNEAERIADTLTSLRAQGRELRIVVVDDESEDNTSALVEAFEGAEVTLVRGRPLPKGWTGKVWAQAQGEPLLARPLVLLLDADIRLSPGMLVALRERLRQQNLGLVSVMAELPMKNTWERVLIPAFVFFFKLLYPFRLVNAPKSPIAAAAGGCVLIKTGALKDIGGFAALKDALIDDCTLARTVKRHGHGVWIGLTRSAVSTRRYRRISDIWNMVARTAFTQLDYSLPMLGLCTVVMAVAFVAPATGLFTGDVGPISFSALAMIFMALSFLPTLKFYRLSPGLSLTLPLAGALFLAMTWTSAIRYFAGERSRWHGRAYGGWRRQERA